MIRVGVVRGGISHKYDESLQTGATVLQVLRDHYPSTYKAVDILITKDGTWHIAGRAVDSKQLADSVDVIWNALHGMYAEDGTLAAQLDAMGIPYTGSGPVASAISSNTHMVKEKARALGLKTSNHYVIPDYRYIDRMVPEVYLKEHAQTIFLKFSPPWIVKPENGTPIIAKTRPELLDALRAATDKPGAVVVEEYVYGRPVSILASDQFRGQDTYTFLPIGTGLTQNEKEVIQQHAKKLYQDLGLRHYAQIHFTVTPKHTYLSEVRTLPEIHPQSSVHQSLTDVGAYLPEFIDHVIQLALTK